MRELSLNVLDIAQNSVAANATLCEIEVIQSTRNNELFIGIYDNGKGMTKEQVKSVKDPFFTTRTTRKVGMGIPLFKMAAEMTGGTIDIESETGVGTKVRASFKTDHLDFTPLGDIIGTVVTLIQGLGQNIDLVFTHKSDVLDVSLDTRELRETLGSDIPLSTPDVLVWITEFLKENYNIT